MKDEEKIKPKVEASPVPVKPKTPAPPPPKRSATEPQLPPKEKERRVSIFSLSSLCGRAMFCVSSSVAWNASLITGSYDKASKKGCNPIEGLSEHVCSVDNIQWSWYVSSIWFWWLIAYSTFLIALKVPILW